MKQTKTIKLNYEFYKKIREVKHTQELKSLEAAIKFMLMKNEKN